MSHAETFDSALIQARIAGFAEQVERRLAGALTEDQFRPLRRAHGVTLDLHSYRLGIGVADGVLDASQLRGLAHCARRYDKGYCHFTAHGTVEFHWPALTDIPAMLTELARVGLVAATAGDVEAPARAGEPAVISAGQMEALADLADRHGSNTVRVVPGLALALPGMAPAGSEAFHVDAAHVDAAA